MIKKIEAKGLLRKNRNLSWDANKILFLYGPNGIGKTTLLDSIYYALTNKQEILMENINGSDTVRPLPYNKIKIFFTDDEEIEISGANNTIHNHEIVDYVFKKIDLSDVLTNVQNVKSVYQNIQNHVKTYYPDVVLEHEEIEETKEAWVNLFNQVDTDVAYIPRIRQIILNYKNNIVGYITYDLNQKLSSIRQKIADKYDVLYLTVDRMAPKLSNNGEHYIYNNTNIFARQFKYLLVKTNKKLMEEFSDEFISFVNHMNSISRSSFIDNILEEDQKIEDDKKIILNSDYIDIYEIACKHFKLELRDLDISQEVPERKKTTRKFIEYINNNSTNLVKSVRNMSNFISDLNDFFRANNKIVVWDKINTPIIQDKNDNSNRNIIDYPFSSGERQIVNILFNIHFFKKEKLLIIADELEISLSPDWQELLFEKINQKDNIELIGVTHSPFVVPKEKMAEHLKAFDNELN